jgi:hypothetical protein
VAQLSIYRALHLPQGITRISVQSSVSLQHLPVDKTIEKGLPKELLARLSFATQKLDEVISNLASIPLVVYDVWYCSSTAAAHSRCAIV